MYEVFSKYSSKDTRSWNWNEVPIGLSKSPCTRYTLPNKILALELEASNLVSSLRGEPLATHCSYSFVTLKLWRHLWTNYEWQYVLFWLQPVPVYSKDNKVFFTCVRRLGYCYITTCWAMCQSLCWALSVTHSRDWHSSTGPIWLCSTNYVSFSEVVENVPRWYMAWYIYIYILYICQVYIYIYIYLQ